MLENELSKEIINSAIAVHREMGPGLLENVYKECLFHSLVKKGFRVEKEKGIPVYFEGEKLDIGFRADLIVERQVLIELKSVEFFHGLHFAQTLTYLRLTNLKLGLLINFNVLLLKDGVKRVVNGL